MSSRTLIAGVLLLALCACGESSGQPAAQRSETTLRVACLNVWAVPLASRDLDVRFARMLPALRRLAPDLVCLQEVFLESTRSRIVEGLGEAYACTEGTAGGLLIASRLPVRSSTFTAFPAHPDLSLAERLAGKGLLEAVVTTAAGPLHVVTTHLAAEFSEDGVRRKQQDFLLQALAKRTDRPVLLAGDLNTAIVTGRGPTAAWRALKAQGFAHPQPPQRREDGWWIRSTPTRVGWPRDGVLSPWSPDHIVLRGSARAAAEFLSYAVELDTAETAVSDHNLLLATVRLVPR